MSNSAKTDNKAQSATRNVKKHLQQLLQRVVVILFNAPTEKKNEATVQALDELTKVLNVDHCHVAIINPENGQLIWVGEGVNTGIEPNNAPYGRFDPSSYSWLLGTLSKKEFLLVDNLEHDLPPEANFVKDNFEEYGYHASLFIPLKKEKILVGWLGFGNAHEKLFWEPDNLEALQAIGSYLYTAITRYKSYKINKSNASILKEAEKLARMGSWEFDLHTGRIRISSQLGNLFGLNENINNPLSLRYCLRVLGHNNWQILKEHLLTIFKTGNKHESVIKLLVNGEEYYFRFISKLTLSKKNVPYLISGIVQDISEKKKADEKLETFQTKQNLILQNIKDYITLYRVVDENTFIIDSFNDTIFELQKLFVPGITKEDILGKDLRNYLHKKVGLPEAYVDEKIAKLTVTVNKGEKLVEDEEVQLPDGRNLFLKTTTTLIRENEQIKYLLWSAYDITELNLTQKELQETEQQYKLALKASNLGFYKWSLANDFLMLDEAYSEMLGLGSSPSQVSTSFLEKSLNEENLKKLQSLVNDCLNAPQNNSTFEIELEYMTSKGNKHVYSSAFFIRNTEYPHGLLIGFARDITDQKIAEEMLRESEARWRSLHESASDAIVVVEDDVFVECNSAALDVFGCLRMDEIIGKTPWAFSPERQPNGRFSKEMGLEYIHQGIQGTKPHFSWIHCRADGTPFDADVSVSAIHFNGRLLVQGIVRDVSERMQMVHAIRESEEKYRSLVESSLQSILIMVENRVRYFNKAFSDLLGYSEEEIFKMDRNELLAMAHPQDRDELREFKEYDLKKPQILEFRLRGKDGNYKWVRCRVGKIAFSAHNSIVVTAIDITEQKKAHELALASATESEDRERQRIAGELHDGLGQLLSSAVLHLGALKSVINELDRKSISNYNTALKTIQSALAETRVISHNLMPKAIKDFGYALAVEQLINSLKEASGVQLSFFTNFRDGRLSPMLERNLYRITQEAVTNIVRHSNAQSAVVQFMKYPDMLILTIEDDGIGFQQDHVDEKKHIGLRNIAIRAETIGARLDIDSDPGHGTILALQIPLIHE